eukprot:PITA_30463
MACTLKSATKLPFVLFLFLLSTAAANGLSKPKSKVGRRSVSRCVAWRLSVETGNLRKWDVVPSKCDAWVFDIDETLLSNIPYYQQHEFGGEAYNSKTFEAWVLEMKSPALPSSLLLYNHLLARGFKIMLLTGRDESQRNITVHNLSQAGYKGWSGLLLSGEIDQGTSAAVYKPKKRGELVKKGYRLWGSVGDQWSDLSGPYEASRSFKLPNPMYFIS